MTGNLGKIEEQPCTACEFIWTGDTECRDCTDRILIQRENEWRLRLFKDFKPRGRNPPC